MTIIDRTTVDIEHWLYPTTVANILSISVRRVYELVQTGELEGRRISGGKSLRITVRSLHDFQKKSKP